MFENYSFEELVSEYRLIRFENERVDKLATLMIAQDNDDGVEFYNAKMDIEREYNLFSEIVDRILGGSVDAMQVLEAML